VVKALGEAERWMLEAHRRRLSAGAGQRAPTIYLFRKLRRGRRARATTAASKLHIKTYQF
jgi:hypothetical protein